MACPAECAAGLGKDDWNLKIIIVGDGKVGYALAEHLSQEEHDVTVIDTIDDALRVKRSNRQQTTM